MRWRKAGRWQRVSRVAFAGVLVVGGSTLHELANAVSAQQAQRDGERSNQTS